MTYKGNVNSSDNQTVKGYLVQRDVYCCLTGLMTALFEKDDDFSIREEFVTTSYYYEGEEFTYDEMQEKIDNSEGELSEMDFEDEIKCPYEFWSVSKQLAADLKEKGETVVEDYGLNIWGRFTTGQAILLDAVISEIAADMGILEGQENHKYWINK